jgi:hypothetical protein
MVVTSEFYVLSGHSNRWVLVETTNYPNTQTPKHRIPKSPLKVNAATVSAVRPFASRALDDPVA